MLPDIPKNLVVDAGYWYALFDPRDALSRDAQAKAHHIESLRVMLPWPTLYETLRTRFVKNRTGMDRFERILKRWNVTYVDDKPYREQALAATIDKARTGTRAISLCDMLIRLLIEDPNLRIRALLTLNVRDFQDVCRIKDVQIL